MLLLTRHTLQPKWTPHPRLAVSSPRTKPRPPPARSLHRQHLYLPLTSPQTRTASPPLRPRRHSRRHNLRRPQARCRIACPTATARGPCSCFRRSHCWARCAFCEWTITGSLSHLFVWVVFSFLIRIYSRLLSSGLFTHARSAWTRMDTGCFAVISAVLIVHIPFSGRKDP